MTAAAASISRNVAMNVIICCCVFSAYAKTVAEAMNLKLDMDNPADREKLRRAVLDLVAGRKMRKRKPHG
jgi:hypothetical protein